MAVTYTVRWRPTDADPGDAWSEETGLTEASHAVTGLTAGVQYDVEVIAVSDGVSSPATAGSSWTRCAAPTSVTPSNVLAETATVSWTGVAGATAYRIERSTDAEDWTEAATTLDGNTTSLGVTGLSESEGYQFRVVAENSVGDSVASAASAEVTTLAIANGGTTTVIGTAPNQYRVHEFASTASTGFSLNATRDVEYLLVGGGGGGGARHGGGGGGGGMLTGRLDALAVGAYMVTVGGGGRGARENQVSDHVDPDPAHNGGDSTFVGTSVGLTALGGGAGGSWSDTVSKKDGADGGSGGGAAVGGAGESGTPGAGLQPTSDDGGLGYAGGTPIAAEFPGTGGGGAGAIGGSNGTGTGTATGGDGGDGSTSSITGSPVVYAGGGGGAGSGAAGSGGAGGGGNGASGDLSGSAGLNWLGGGGGGARSDNASATCTGGKGGAGVVILRYRLTPGA